MNVKNKRITVEAIVKAPIEKVWELWTMPEHIKKWNQATDDWHTPKAENDLRPSGRFVSRMEAKDGSVGFDFGGTYDVVKINQRISYTLDDGRKVEITFSPAGSQTKIKEAFEAQNANPVEMQRGGWQAILDSFKKYAESKK